MNLTNWLTLSPWLTCKRVKHNRSFPAPYFCLHALACSLPTYHLHCWLFISKGYNFCTGLDKWTGLPLVITLTFPPLMTPSLPLKWHYHQNFFFIIQKYNICLIFLPNFKAKFVRLPDFFTILICQFYGRH